MVKFLVVRFSSIGDIVLTTPVVRCLKKQVEEAEVHYLTKSSYSEILRGNPYIDKIHVLDKNYHKVLRSLQEENIDYIIDLHHNLRTSRLKLSLKRLSYSFDKLNLKKWILVNFKYNLLPSVHIVDRYFKTVELFSVKNDNKGLDFFVPAKEESDLSFMDKENRINYLVIVVGGGHYTKQIPVDHIIGLINDINCPIVMLGGEQDINKANQVEKAVNRKDVYNLTGKISINQSASIIQQSKLIITPDTGLMHIAAAYKKNILSVWGNTIPEFGMYPYLPGEASASFEVRNLRCRPCSKIGFNKCPKGHFNCMKMQDYKGIAMLAKKLITN